ncbi:MAG: histidine triad nucleotide-binding protein [Puniceicoccaceae bacterium]
MAEPTLFEKILAGDIPANIAYQDDLAFVIHDISPQAPVHVLVIPKKPVARLDEANEEDAQLLGHLLLVAKKMAGDLNLQDGYRVIINNGPDGGESVPHMHVHVLGGRRMTWPPG